MPALANNLSVLIKNFRRNSHIEVAINYTAI